MEPCKQEGSIKKLFDLHDKKMEKLHTMEVRQVEIQGDIKHMRGRFDNGFSNTIHSMDEKLSELVPKIHHNTKWIGYLETTAVWTVRVLLVSFIISAFGVMAWAIANGWKS